MRDTAAALKAFFSGFGLPAYAVGSVPKGVELPYITFPLAEPEWHTKATFYAQIWVRDTENAALFAKADEILRAIGTGRRLFTDAGVIVLWPESPAMQLMVDGEIRSAYLNFSINSYHLPGTLGRGPEEGETP